MNKGALGFPLGRGQRVGLGFPVGKVRGQPLSSGQATTSVTGPAGTNTESGWNDIGRGEQWTADGFWLTLMPNLAAVSDFQLDLGLGGDPPWEIIVSNLVVGGSLRPPAIMDEVYVPLAVPAFVPVMARHQSTDASAPLVYCTNMVRGEPYTSLRCLRSQTYGANPADSGGTSIDPGGVANTKGAWVELTAATLDPIRYMIVSFGTQNNAARGAEALVYVDIGVGRAGSERVVVPGLTSRIGTGTDGINPSLHPRWVSIPAGERLVARSACSDTDATDRLTDVSVVAFGP